MSGPLQTSRIQLLLGNPRELVLAKQLQLLPLRSPIRTPTHRTKSLSPEIHQVTQGELTFGSTSSSLYPCPPPHFSSSTACLSLARRPLCSPSTLRLCNTGRVGTRRQYSVAEVPKSCCTLGLPGELSKLPVSRLHHL